MNATEPDVKQRRKLWLARLADEFEKVEKLLPAHLVPTDIECPKWVENVEREVALVLFSAAKLRGVQVMTPKRMGAIIGHSCEMAVWTMESLAGGMQKPDGDVKRPLTGDALKGVEELFQSLGIWYDAARRLAKLSLCSCVDQPYEDMRDFLLGYAEGFSRKPNTFNVGEMGNPTFEIYLFLIIYWRPIEKLSSVRQLHEVLMKVFGGSRVGDQKRIEKICQRIGLTFRKPGRPKQK